MQNIGSFNTRSVAPVPADVLVDVWQLATGECAVEINIHPDDLDEGSTCLMIRGAELAALTEAAAVASDPGKHRPLGPSVIPISSDLEDAIAQMS
jgi:hypothetical protein